MTKVYSALDDTFLRSSISNAVFSEEVISAFAVRRPLDCPSTDTKFGPVLSHSGVVVRTNSHNILIEYMFCNSVYVGAINKLKIEDNQFNYRHYHFYLDSKEQKPEKRVTVREFADTMANFMRVNPFDTFTHNCHEARYRTMKAFGMSSKNYKSGATNVLFQGVIDYFRPEKKVPLV